MELDQTVDGGEKVIVKALKDADVRTYDSSGTILCDLGIQAT